jgi:hypothetical protein
VTWTRILLFLGVVLVSGCASTPDAIRATQDTAVPNPTRIGFLLLDGPDAPSSELLSRALEQALSQQLGAATTRLAGEGPSADALRGGFRRGEISGQAILETSARYGVDAVLVGRITRYRPYPPQAVGMELALVSAVTGQIIWNALGVIDADDPQTDQAIRGGMLGVLARNAPVGALDDLENPREAFLILQSPTRFAKFVAARFVETLSN